MSGRRLIGPVQWMGGKGNMVRHLLPLVPEHTVYVEAFGGGAALLFAKAPSPVEVYNDVDGNLVNLFRVIRDPEQAVRLRQALELTPYSREELEAARAEPWPAEGDAVERARRFFIMARQSFGGKAYEGGWGYDFMPAGAGARVAACWLGAIERLPEIHQRLRAVQVECSDWRRVLDACARTDAFLYLDPPYLPDTRKGGSYAHELTAQDHQELVERLLAIHGKVMLSGYAHPLYAPLEAAGWARLDFRTVCHAVGHTRETGVLGTGAGKDLQQRTESVWLNYRPPLQQAFDMGFAEGAEECQN